MAETFVGYCKDPSKVVAALPQHIVPNAQDFYRSLGYQVADVYPDKNRRRPMKNLLQSVYAHCELNREGARGTYWGTRVAELPPTGGDSTHDDILGVQLLPPLDPVAEIPVAENIGDIVARVLEECAPMPELTDMNAEHATVGDKWAHVADAFARYSSSHQARYMVAQGAAPLEGGVAPHRRWATAPRFDTLWRPVRQHL